MAGRDRLGAQFVRGIEEMLELDLAVAQHVRVRRAAGGDTEVSSISSPASTAINADIDAMPDV